MCVCVRERERERERERQTDRQTDRQTETERDRDRQTDRESERHRDRDGETERESVWQRQGWEGGGGGERTSVDNSCLVQATHRQCSLPPATRTVTIRCFACRVIPVGRIHWRLSDGFMRRRHR